MGNSLSRYTLSHKIAYLQYLLYMLQLFHFSLVVCKWRTLEGTISFFPNLTQQHLNKYLALMPVKATTPPLKNLDESSPTNP